MADEIDLANDLIDREVSIALNKLKKMTSDKSKGAKYCIECSDNIPKIRQKLGYKLCVPCAEEAERRKSLFAE